LNRNAIASSDADVAQNKVERGGAARHRDGVHAAQAARHLALKAVDVRTDR
jgi:hypothetical protein